MVMINFYESECQESFTSKFSLRKFSPVFISDSVTPTND